MIGECGRCGSQKLPHLPRERVLIFHSVRTEFVRRQTIHDANDGDIQQKKGGSFSATAPRLSTIDFD